MTGDGDAIEVPMLDVMAYVNFPEIFAMRTFVDDEPVDARNRQMMANHPVEALDGWLLLSPVSADQIRDAMKAVGYPEWAEEVLAEKDGAADDEAPHRTHRVADPILDGRGMHGPLRRSRRTGRAVCRS